MKWLKVKSDVYVSIYSISSSNVLYPVDQDVGPQFLSLGNDMRVMWQSVGI